MQIPSDSLSLPLNFACKKKMFSLSLSLSLSLTYYTIYPLK